MIPLGSPGVFQVSTIEVNLVLFARLSTGPGANGIEEEIPFREHYVPRVTCLLSSGVMIVMILEYIPVFALLTPATRKV